MGVFGAVIEDRAVVAAAADAIEEAAQLIPRPIPYMGRAFYPSGLKAIAKGVRKGFIQMAYMVGPPGSTAGYTDQKGPLILLPMDYPISTAFARSCAVHEAIHACVDAAGYKSPFVIRRHVNEFIAHLGQTCYAIAKGAKVNEGAFANFCCRETESAARSFAASGKIPRNEFDEAMAAIRGLYNDGPIKCNGWRVPNY